MIQKMKEHLTAVQKVLYIIIGAPHYTHYLEHLRTYHPDKIPMDEKDFYKQMDKDKAGGKIRRCC